MSWKFTKRILDLMENCEDFDHNQEDPMLTVLNLVESLQKKQMPIPFTLHLLVAKLSIENSMFEWALKAIYAAQLTDPYNLELETISLHYHSSLQQHLNRCDLCENDLIRIDKIIIETERFGLADEKFYRLVAKCYAWHGYVAKANLIINKFLLEVPPLSKLRNAS